MTLFPEVNVLSVDGFSNWCIEEAALLSRADVRFRSHVTSPLRVFTKSDWNVHEHPIDVVTSISLEVPECWIEVTLTATVRCQKHCEPAFSSPIDTCVHT